MTRPVPPASAPTSPPRSGIPDGAVIALLALLLGSVALVWTATGLAAVVTHGSWPGHLPFTRSAQAIRHLVTQPHDLTAAWASTGDDAGPQPLPSATAFWWTFFSLLVLLTTLLLLGLAARARLRQAARRTAGPVRAVPVHCPQPVDELFAPIAPIAAEAPAHPVPPAAPRPAVPSPKAAADPAPAAGPHPLSFAALLPRASAIRPHPDTGLAGPGARSAPDPLAYGVALGVDTTTGTPLYAPLDRGHCVFAPPSAAVTKGPALVQPAVLRAPGPVLVTCAGPATWEATAARREKTGPVLVFDPLRLTSAEAPQRLRWAPHDRCDDPATATARADALLHPVVPLHRSGSAAVHTTARTLLRCWLHAAALDGRPFRQVHRWAGGHGTRDAVRILRTDHGAAEGWSGELEAALAPAQHATGGQLMDAARELLARTLSSLEELHVLQSCTPSMTDRLDVESLLAERGTLYLVAEPVEAPHHQPGAMPLLTALAQDVVEHGRRMAVRSSSGRLDPPLLAVLDDVAAVAPLPGLPDLVARGGAQGVAALVLLRSPEQARARWEERSVHRLWTAAASRTVLGPATASSVQALLAATADPHSGERPGPSTTPGAGRGAASAAEGEAVVLHPASGLLATVRFHRGG
ncbi:TraM recognition domain-containing protein [Peterkaempfera sp. SMS 1(5)a]|uniref:TraM recognition domain-containing protein n=1 Tax=Peterkaempfera podocarpi TaxID=3232308 RepID=UPI00366B6803